MTVSFDTGDVIEIPGVDRREDVRLIISLPARYMLANRRNAKGDRREFACRIVNISLGGIAMAAPAAGQIGERVIVYSEPFGRLHGAITRLIAGGFVMSIAISDEGREKLRAKLSWFSKEKDDPGFNQGRRHARVVPRNPMASLLLADGSTASCLVVDFSESGAAISADLDPKIGTPMAVGKMVGRVVRRFAEGFAVEFTEKATLAEIEFRLGRPLQSLRKA